MNIKIHRLLLLALAFVIISARADSVRVIIDSCPEISPVSSA